MRAHTIAFVVAAPQCTRVESHLIDVYLRDLTEWPTKREGSRIETATSTTLAGTAMYVTPRQCAAGADLGSWNRRGTEDV